MNHKTYSREDHIMSSINFWKWDDAEKWCRHMYWGKKDRSDHKLLTGFGFVLAKLELL